MNLCKNLQQVYFVYLDRNILEDEDNIRFRKIKPENQAFSRKVWSCRPAREFMIACGWLEVSLAKFLIFSMIIKTICSCYFSDGIFII